MGQYVPGKRQHGRKGDHIIDLQEPEHELRGPCRDGAPSDVVPSVDPEIAVAVAQVANYPHNSRHDILEVAHGRDRARPHR